MGDIVRSVVVCVSLRGLRGEDVGVRRTTRDGVRK